MKKKIVKVVFIKDSTAHKKGDWGRLPLRLALKLKERGFVRIFRDTG